MILFQVFGFLVVICFTFDILLAFMALRELGEEAAVGQELRESRSTQSTSGYPLKHVTGRGSYRHSQSSTLKLKESTPVILKEGTPIGQL